MGKRINPINFRLPYQQTWDSYLPLSTYNEFFGYYVYLWRWCNNLFHYLIRIRTQIRNNHILLTVVLYLPSYNRTKKATSRFFRRAFRKFRRLNKRRLTYKERQNVNKQFAYWKKLYKVQEAFYYKRLLNRYRKFLELIFTKTLKKRVRLQIINVADCFKNKKRHRMLIVTYLILQRKLSSFYRRFNRNYKHIVKLFALSSYLGEPLLLVAVVKRLFKVSRRHFLVLRLLKSYLDLIYLFNPRLEGVKFQIKGKFGGRLRTRKMIYQRGKIPTQTVNVVMKYAGGSFTTKAGAFGVRVWYNFGSPDLKYLAYDTRKKHLKGFYKTKNYYLVEKSEQKMTIKNFFNTWLNYKVRQKRKKQKKIVLKQKRKYGKRDKQKSTKK